MAPPRISPKKLALHQEGKLGGPSFQPLPPNRRMQTTGTTFLSMAEDSVYIPARSPRKSPTKRATKPTPDNMVFESNSFNRAPGPGSHKRATQFDNWMKLLPDLIPVYLDIMRETHSLQNYLGLRVGNSESMEDIDVPVCQCSSSRAPLLLMQGGLFPCSPCNPTLAVELPLLQFVMELSLNIAPNNTAFCKTMENFLAHRGYKMASGERLRIRFGNTVQWFTQLVAMAEKSMNDVLAPARVAARDRYLDDSVDPPPDQPINEEAVNVNVDPPDRHVNAEAGPSTVTPSQTGRKRRHEDSEAANAPPPPPNPYPEPAPQQRPSDYLIERCPACFSGLKHDDSQIFDLAICIDGNFTQKRYCRTGAQDPPRQKPDSVFLPRSRAKDMEAHVDGVRGAHKEPKRKKANTEPEDDGYEGNLKVPTSGLNACEASFKAADETCEKASTKFFAETGLNLKVPTSGLNACEASFKAADETREKASTKFFAETGLMGMCCRHDIPLFLELLQHLPANIIIGTMYDVTCQLDRSCAKFDFLSRYKDRIIFAVSVFHAFAHIWACQLIYHPQKCLGFGGSNGEGSERVWFKLSHLISNLRVGSYHQRIFTLDMQVTRDSMEVTRGIAEWLRRRTYIFEAKYREANVLLSDSALSEAQIQEKWDAQIAYQTRPLAKRSKQQAATAINNVLVADQTVALLQKRGDNLTRHLGQAGLALAEQQSLQDSLESNQKSLTIEITKRDKLISKLGSGDRSSLTSLKFRPYYSAQLAARTLKQWLTARKMEYDLIERSVRRYNSEHKKNQHASAAIKKRKPNIKKIAKQYNEEVAKIEKLIAQKKVPANTRAPERLELDRIFELDIDDSIWLDVGLTDDGADLPEALLDPEVRSMICALLQKRRAEEELHCLRREHGHLRIYLASEWEALQATIAGCNDAESLDALSASVDAPDLGPTQAELTEARITRVVPAWRTAQDGDDASDIWSDDGAPEDEDDPAIIAVLSTIERANNQLNEDDESDEEDIFADIERDF
ncbi:hypothetical protein C8F01DRAFT_1258582 [Mycena amicta]|nr:hypothetical protein C8F01DRAFT_1258582 [Mycena amicta]